jgi:hypothetical protein
MPSNSNTPPEKDSLLKKYLALKVLRDNIYYQHPGKYSFTDVAEDLPSSLQPSVPYLKELAPSLATISQDPEIRAKQIALAVDKVRHSQKSKDNVVSQATENALKLGLISLPAGFLVGAGARLLGPRLPINRWGEFRSPVQLNKNLSRAISDPGYRGRLLGHSWEDAKINSLLAAGVGATTPVISSEAKPSDKELSSAAEILQNHPYSTALPGGELSALISSNNNNPYVGPLSAGVAGAGVGGAATFIGPAKDAIKRLLGTNISYSSPGQLAFNYPEWRKVSYPFLRAARTGLLRNSLIGAGIGLGTGYLSSQNNNPTQVSENI